MSCLMTLIKPAFTRNGTGTILSLALAEWVEINVDSLGLQPGDAVTFVLSAGGTRGTTDALNIYAVEVIYRSDLAYNVTDER